MNTIDPLKLQRLVDGELETAQVQKILASAKASPEQWEEIAIGFVEDQIWQRSVRFSLADESTSGLASLLPDQELKAPKSNSSGFSWLALAAMVLVSAGLGFLGADLIQENADPGGTTVVDNAPESSSPLIQPQLANNDLSNIEIEPGFTKADYHFEVPEQHSERFGGPVGKVPLYAVSNQDQLNQLTQQQQEIPLSDDLVRQLNGSGYQLQRDVEFISGRMGDGRSFVVPVQTIRFLPGQ